ncbi:meiosis-specific cyclin Rem1 [Mactra antiquata]
MNSNEADDNSRMKRARSFRERPEKTGEGLRRVRSFKTTSKGLVNRGDSFKSRKNASYDGSAIATRENFKDDSTLQAVHTNIIPQLITTKTDDQQHYFRVLMTGAQGVGKSSIIDQFMTSEFLGSGNFNVSQSEEDRTITLQVDGEESTLEFMQSEDFQNQEECFQIDGFVAVYNITDRISFDIAIDIMKQIREEVGTNKAIILVGNKSDLVRKRTISQDEGRSAADSYGCKYIEISAALNHNVDELLVGIHKQIILKCDANEDNTSTNDEKKKVRKSSFKKTKQFLEKIFLGQRGKDKNTENLYVS